MHLGVIPDGNRRFAERNNLPKTKAYTKAKQVIVDLFTDLDDFPLEIDEITIYLLSEENLSRSDDELEDLFELLENHMDTLAEKFSDEGFSFNWATTKPEALPAHLSDKLENLEDKFDGGKKQLNALISYSGKKDILESCRAVNENGGKFTEDSLRKHLQVGSDIEYVIRTGDNPTRECISGFPLWNSSYAEYYHIKKNFPAIDRNDIDEALSHFQKLRRKKGE